MSKHADDFLPILKAAIAEARELGLNEECDALEQQALACTTTASEFLAEIQRFKTRTKGRLNPSIKQKLRFCLTEIGKVWPKFRPRLPWA
ncbi:MAG: hypothetical protein ABFE02_07190 [Sulfuricella sp.]